MQFYVGPEKAGWSAAAIIGMAFYGFALWLIWRTSRVSQARMKGLTSVGPSPPSDELPPNAVPDMSIHDLFFHICPKVLENANEKRWESVARDVMDKFSTDQLAAWGREINPKLNMTGPLVAIHPEYWRTRVFIYHFLSPDKGIGNLDGKVMAHTYSWQDPNSLQYADLQVNRMQAFKLWPQRLREIRLRNLVPDRSGL